MLAGQTASRRSRRRSWNFAGGRASQGKERRGESPGGGPVGAASSSSVPWPGRPRGPHAPPRPPRPFPPPGDLSRGSAGPAHPLHSHRRIAPSRPGPLEHNTPASPRAAEGTPPRAAALASRSGTGEDGRALSFRREAAHSRRPRRLPEAGARLSWGRVPAAGSKLKRFCVSPHPPGSRRRQA